MLVTIATRGYPENGAGAEVRFGEGIAGLVAEARKPIRISGLMRGMLYAFAMHKEAAEAAAGLRRARRIPVPGLANPESQLGVPLLVRGELVGVLCLESEVPYRFHEEDKASIELLGSYLAIAIQNMQLQERSADAAAETPAPAPARRRGQPTVPAGRARRDVVYYAADECILLDGEYLIRSLPAKILWRLLNARESTGAPGVHQSRAAARQVAESARSGRTTWRAACCSCAAASKRRAPTSGWCRAPADASLSSLAATSRSACGRSVVALQSFHTKRSRRQQFARAEEQVMVVEREQLTDIVILRPIGALDSSSSPDLERMLAETLKAGTLKLVFDFSRLDYISSAGLRVVLLAGKKLRGTGKVVLVGMNDMVRDVFSMSGFLTLFPAAATIEAGVKLF